jgi:2-polyprenyl-3-methyl-5-hydroxy-6-metoxy-1,4-benzoquinol methylase
MIYPTSKENNLLVGKILLSELKMVVPKYVNGNLLDIRCGEKPLNKMIAPYVTEHIGLDHENSLHNKSKIDLFGTAYNIPIENGYFDTVLCTAVLEHLEEPDKAI